VLKSEMSVNEIGVNFQRLPKHLRESVFALYEQPTNVADDFLQPGHIYHGDAVELLPKIAPNSLSLSVWSPPYFVGKDYEAGLTFDSWRELLRQVISLHFPIT